MRLSLLCLPILAFACQSVLGIDEPTLRPAAAGTGADTSRSGEGGAEAGAGATQSGGSAGKSPFAPAGGTSGKAGMGGRGGSGDAGEAGSGGDAGEAGAAGRTEAGHGGTGAGGTQGGRAGSAGSEAGAGMGGSGECEDGDLRCDGVIAEECNGGKWQDQRLCLHYCRAGHCENPPSCKDSPACGESISCCRALAVPGGEFLRDYDGKTYKDASHPATVSAFVMGKFEVTVKRMRNFVDAYSELHFEPGDGKSDHIPADQGWKDTYELPASKEELVAALQCQGGTYTVDAGNETLPVNCVTFAVAYAFCIWDGGRLPTETEWNFAAAGGAEQREFPWQGPLEEESPTPAYAYFDHFGSLPSNVGSTPMGDGLFGHSDLAGNVIEWTLDTFSWNYPDKCVNCLSTSTTGERSLRGGSYIHYAEQLAVAARWPWAADESADMLGFRCVYDIY